MNIFTRTFCDSKKPSVVFVSLLILVVALADRTVSIAGSGASIPGQLATGAVGIQKTTAEITALANSAGRTQIYSKPEREIPGRENRPLDPTSPAVQQFPAQLGQKSSALGETTAGPYYPQSIGVTFDGVTGPNETGAFPPDTMGTVGPSQFIIFVNGRLRSFNKATGVADGVLNVNPDDFFASVETSVAPPGFNFTSDPQIRYDRLTSRWILTIIDVPSSSPFTVADTPNRLLIAVSDSASQGVITSNTVWTFYFVQQNTVGGGDSGEFLDYPSLGVDDNALYVGGNMFTSGTGTFVNTSAFVIRKSSILNGGPIVVTAFRDLISGGDGPDTPRGVDNFDPVANEGYILGTSDATLGRLILRRVNDPGGTPTISSNIAITVNATSHPIPVDHFGNTGGATGRLDAIDDRLFAVHIRNGRLWTAHNIAVDANGVASTVDANRRDAVRWYELNGIRTADNGGTPVVVQSGTIFDPVATVDVARQYWMPSVTVSGQGHSALGFSTAGTPFRVNAATNGRLVGDVPGTLSLPTFFTNSSTSYNPAQDPGGSSGRRWGDYSFTSLDPNDDMTMWTVQEFCDGTNTYGVQVAKLFAPPPATPGSASSTVPIGQTSTVVTITGISVSGSGFFDPGNGFASRIGASVTGGASGSVTVNSVTYIDPTHVTLDLNTTAASNTAYNVTITNPDGQSRTGNGILAVGSAVPSPSPTVTPTPTATPLPTPTPTPTPAPTPPYGEITEPTPSPSPGAVLINSTVTFKWTSGIATAYWLTIGDQRVSEPGGSNIFSSGQTGGRSWTVSNLPTDGRALSVRLWSLVNGAWYNPPRDYPYIAQPVIVLTPVISPASGKYKKKVTVNMADGTPGATIYYTTDGSTPDVTKTKFTGPFTLGRGTTTVKAIAVSPSVNPPVPNSNVASTTYTVR